MTPDEIERALAYLGIGFLRHGDVFDVPKLMPSASDLRAALDAANTEQAARDLETARLAELADLSFLSSSETTEAVRLVLHRVAGK